MKKLFALFIIVSIVPLALALPERPVTQARTEINIPNIPGYLTLKCDFHMHTVFSDGLVWPTVRVEEAWREGLDAIAFTDHIEYLPHAKDISTNNLNRAADIAIPASKDLDIIVIRGSEISRKMPPGHLNAIFLTNATVLATTDWRDAVKAARQQGAFIFWNHPGWEKQLQDDGIVRWYPEHTELYEQGVLGGIEVVNHREYYPEAHRWALEKKLAILCNSDIHPPMSMDYHLYAGDHRPMTLVFAKERTPEAIKEALLNRRTAAYASNELIGSEEFLRPIFEKSIRLKKNQITLKGKQRVLLQIANDSDIDYLLERTEDLPDIAIPKKLTLAARKTVLFDVRGKGTAIPGKKTLELPYKVTNLLVGPNEPLPISIVLDVTFTK